MGVEGEQTPDSGMFWGKYYSSQLHIEDSCKRKHVGLCLKTNIGHLVIRERTEASGANSLRTEQSHGFPPAGGPLSLGRSVFSLLLLSLEQCHCPLARWHQPASPGSAEYGGGRVLRMHPILVQKGEKLCSPTPFHKVEYKLAAVAPKVLAGKPGVQGHLWLSGVRP